MPYCFIMSSEDMMKSARLMLLLDAQHRRDDQLHPLAHFVVGAGVLPDDPQVLVVAGDAGEILIEHERVEEVLDELLVLARQLSHDSEIEVAGAAVVQHPQVPGVHVRVEGPCTMTASSQDFAPRRRDQLPVHAQTRV